MSTCAGTLRTIGAKLVDDPLEVVEGAHVDAGDDLVAPRGVGVEQRDDPEPAAAEPRVVGERLAQVADADDDDRPVLGDADLAGDLVAQVVDVVPDAAGAVAAQVGEVLAQLGAVDPGGRRQLLARAGGGALVGERRQRAEVDGESRDGGLGDVPGTLGGGPCGHCGVFSKPSRPGLGRWCWAVVERGEDQPWRAVAHPAARSL